MSRLDVKNADERRPIRTRQAMLESAEFKALWDRIKDKTTFRVQFDNEALKTKCAESIQASPAIAKTRLQWRTADLAINKAGVENQRERTSDFITLNEGDIELPDLITDLQDRTQLTRRSIVEILTASGRLGDFTRNPQQFIEQCADAINHTKRLFIVDGIKYHRIGDDAYYAQELFVTEELSGYLSNALASTRSVYEYVIYDSAGVERSFAEQLEGNSAIKVYAKLPGWFKVPTPLGTYNPDWAILIEKDGGERVYFVVETKGSLFKEDLRDKEAGKIKCGKAHFAALSARENPPRYTVARTLEDVLGEIG